MRKLHLHLIVIFLFFSTFPASAADMAEKMKIQNQNVVKAAAEEFSKDLPKRVDRYTRLIEVEADGEKLVYIFEIDAAPKSDDEVVKEGKTKMERRVVAGTCATSQRFLKSGITLSYRYLSAATKRTLFDIDVKEADCLNMSLVGASEIP